MSPKKIVVTGGPGTGKTSVIELIEKNGFPCFHEISRSITLEAREQGIPQLFVSHPLLFSKKILEGRIQQFKEAASCTDQFIFMDRGLPDVVAYLEGVPLEVDAYFEEACFTYRYDMVFLLPPWKEIYKVDNERHEDFEEALRIHGYLEQAYTRFGYAVQEVPLGTVAERTAFILNRLNKPQ